MSQFGTTLGLTLGFGIAAEQASLSTTRFSCTKSIDKKEARGATGAVIAVAYYNPRVEITIEGFSAADPTQAVGAALTLASPPSMIVGTTYAEELNVDFGNEDFNKVSIKATAYDAF